MNEFAVLSIEYSNLEHSICIYLETNNPCHLYCYHTKVKPQRHPTSRILRGLPVPWGAYYCFVAWKPVEQVEPGDTLYHTFHLPAWFECQTRWFCFKGNVGAQLSPSASPIFRHHHPGATSNLFEHYITGDDNNTGGMGYGQYWFSQTFTPFCPHTVNSVKLLLYRAGLPGAVTVSIRATTWGKPSGPDLCAGITNGNTLPTGAPYEWRQISLGAGTWLNSATKYALVVRSEGIRYDNRVICRLDASAPTYTRGQYVNSNDWGVTWIINPPDLMFEEWFIV